MKISFKPLMIVGLLFTVFTLLPEFTNAQIGDPSEDPDAPIDGGVGLLLAAGVGYGIKKVRQGRKNAKSADLGDDTAREY